MFKWILIFFLTFLVAWMFAKDRIPQTIVASRFGEYFQSVIFPLEYKIHKNSYKGGTADSLVVKLDSSRLSNVLQTADSKEDAVIMYFYRTDSLLSRHMLHTINKLAAQPRKKKILFLVISFDEDTKLNSYLLNIQGKLNFRPFSAAPNEITTAKYYFQKHEIGFSETPVMIYKSSAGEYTNIGVDFETKSQLEALIGRDK